MLLLLLALAVDDEGCLDLEWVCVGCLGAGLPVKSGFGTDETPFTDTAVGDGAGGVRVSTGKAPTLPLVAVVEGGALELESNDIVQVRSSLTISSPLSPVMGVKTMLHVSMKFPASVGMCVIVVTI